MVVNTDAAGEHLFHQLLYDDLTSGHAS